MRGLAFRIVCSHCGSPSSRLVNQTRRGGTELVGIVECCVCHRQYAIHVLLRSHGDPSDAAKSRAYRLRQKALL